jgi:hypothetical protein
MAQGKQHGGKKVFVSVGLMYERMMQGLRVLVEGETQSLACSCDWIEKRPVGVESVRRHAPCQNQEMEWGVG